MHAFTKYDIHKLKKRWAHAFHNFAIRKFGEFDELTVCTSTFDLCVPYEKQ